MDDLSAYYQRYSVGDTADSGSGTTTDYGYTCPQCGVWVPSGTYHYCSPYTTYGYYHVYPENRTEKAFKILKALVENKIIKEPNSFKKFCELIEKISEVI